MNKEVKEITIGREKIVGFKGELFPHMHSFYRKLVLGREVSLYERYNCSKTRPDRFNSENDLKVHSEYFLRLPGDEFLTRFKIRKYTLLMEADYSELQTFIEQQKFKSSKERDALLKMIVAFNESKLVYVE